MEHPATEKFLIIFDFGQTLCYNCETYEEFVHNQVTALYKVFVEKITTMPSSELHRLGLAALPLEAIAKDSANYKEKFLMTMTESIVKFKDLKNDKYVSQEVGLDAQFLRVLIEGDVFQCGFTPSLFTQEQMKELAGLGKDLLRNDKCIVAKYACFDGLKELLARYQADQRFVLAICTNTSYAKKQRALIHQCGLDHFFDATIVSSEVGIRKPNPEILGLLKKQYPQFKDYQMCIIGDMIDRDILCGSNANIRTIWFTQSQFDPAVNYKKIKDCKPDFTFTQYAQLPRIIDTMLRDASYLETQPEEIQQNYRKPEFYARLPSQQMLKVAYYFPPEAESSIIQERGYAITNGKVLYYPFQINCPLEVQPTFSVLLHQAADLCAGKRLAEIMKGQKIVVINPLDKSELFANPTERNKRLNEILLSPGILGVQSKHGARVQAIAPETEEGKVRVTCFGASASLVATKPVSEDFLIEFSKNIAESLGTPLVAIEYAVGKTQGEYYLVSVREVYEEKLDSKGEVKLTEFLQGYYKLALSS